MTRNLESAITIRECDRPNVTCCLAARFADEIDLAGLEPDQVSKAIPAIRDRCDEIDRARLATRVSVNVFWQRTTREGIQDFVRRAAESKNAL